MKRILLILLACLLLPAQAAWSRDIVPMNREWTFTLGDPAGAQQPAFDDRQWQAANLPHSFSTPYFLGTGFYVGYGWYRKQLVVPPSWKGKHLSLEFDGVFQEAEIFVNGVRAGQHRGGYTGFSVDISSQTRQGSNTIAVRVNNRWDATLAPRSGEHVFSGGIYRDVRLVVADPVHVAWYGTFVKTPSVSRERATLAIETEISNASPAERKIVLQSKVYAPGGALVSQARSEQAVAPGQTLLVKQQPRELAKPSLWGLGHPALYKLQSEVYVGGKLVDRYTTPFGVRFIEWTADRGFFLNGEHLYLVGANVHQDHAGWGDAVTQAGARRDVQMIKDAGFNFIRGSHYPHSPAFTQATDELGIMYWSEVSFWGMGGYGDDPGWLSSAYPPRPEDRPGFEASVLAQSAEMIRIHRNRPSIITWSNGNEIFFTAQQAMDAARAFIRRQAALMRELDPTRPVAIGGSQRGELDKLGDIAGYNGDGAELFLNPGVANIVSEYGSTIADRPGNYEPGWGNLTGPADQRGSKEKYPWRYAWRSGEVIWAGFDHGSIAAIPFGSMGMIDYFRIPKRQYYWYRNEYAGVPPPAWPVDGIPARLALSASSTTIKGTQGHDDVHLLATVHDREGTLLTAVPDVTLAIESGPGEFPTGRSITFSKNSLVAIRDGQAAIEFRSYYAGKTRIRASSPGLEDAVIEITTTGPDSYVEGRSPLAPARPILNYSSQGAPVKESDIKNVSLNRPTSASPSVPGHAALLANDDNPDTEWQASDPREATWAVDLENIYDVRDVSVDGPSSSNGLVIESSLDGTNWQAVGGLAGDLGHLRVGGFSHAVKARFMRIRFTAQAASPAVLKEFRVYAVPAR